MASHRDPTYELSNVQCREGVVTGEIRNVVKRYGFTPSPRVRAWEPWGGHWRVVQDSHSAPITIDRGDTTKLYPFALSIAKRERGGGKIRIRVAGGKAEPVEVTPCGTALGSDWWHGWASRAWWRTRRN